MLLQSLHMRTSALHGQCLRLPTRIGRLPTRKGRAAVGRAGRSTQDRQQQRKRFSCQPLPGPLAGAQVEPLSLQDSDYAPKRAVAGAVHPI